MSNILVRGSEVDRDSLLKLLVGLVGLYVSACFVLYCLILYCFFVAWVCLFVCLFGCLFVCLFVCSFVCVEIHFSSAFSMDDDCHFGGSSLL